MDALSFPRIDFRMAQAVGVDVVELFDAAIGLLERGPHGGLPGAPLASCPPVS